MKKTTLLLLLAACACMTFAQTPEKSDVPISFDTVGADTSRAIAIVDNYLKKVDFSQSRTDSVLCVVSYVVDRSHPHDTMTIYRWYMQPRYNRIEIWQNGRMENAFHSDGVKLFRKFHTGRREWADLTPDSYYNTTIPLDIRGALYDWRSKGAEMYYAGEAQFKGQTVDRVFVTQPEIFDRYYFFERSTGMLGMVLEDEHIFGDRMRGRNAVKVDWRAWEEFVPFHEFYLPRQESYQMESQVVVIQHNYHYEAPQLKLFTEDFRLNR